MREWFAQALGAMEVGPDLEGYLLGRGARPQDIAEMGMLAWSPPAEGCTEDPAWCRFGREGRGEHLEGMLVVPLYSARGELLGADFRQVFGEKQILRYLLPEIRSANGKTWVAVFVGMRPSVARALWEGSFLWLVEGLFDWCAMRWVIPADQQVLACDKAALNDAQRDLLRRLLPRGSWVGLVLDMDKPGRRGTYGWKDKSGKYHVGIAEQLEGAGLRPWVVPYLKKDPGDIWDKGGRAALQRVFGNLSKEIPGGT